MLNYYRPLLDIEGETIYVWRSVYGSPNAGHFDDAPQHTFFPGPVDVEPSIFTGGSGSRAFEAGSLERGRRFLKWLNHAEAFRRRDFLPLLPGSPVEEHANGLSLLKWPGGEGNLDLYVVDASDTHRGHWHDDFFLGMGDDGEVDVALDRLLYMGELQRERELWRAEINKGRVDTFGLVPEVFEKEVLHRDLELGPPPPQRRKY